MLNAILKSIVGGSPSAPSPAPTPPPAAMQPPVPAPTPVDAPATIPDFANDAASASSPEAPPPPAASAPAPTAQATAPEPAAAAPAGQAAVSAAPLWHSVPLSFRPDPSIRSDEDTARARAIETQRQLWAASLVERVGTPAVPPTLLAAEAPDASPEPSKSVAA